MPTDVTYSLADLCDLADVTPRTVRYYVAQGLLPGPTGGGPSARYTEGHLARLRLVRRLQREHLPLAEIRTRLGGLSDEEVAVLVESPEEVAKPGDSALDYIRSVLAGGRRRAVAEAAATYATPSTAPAAAVPARAAAAQPSPTNEPDRPATAPQPERSSWERIALAPDIELHVRRPLSRLQNRRVERLVTIARELLEED